MVVLGASSGMAQALLPLLFERWQSCCFYLLARNIGALQNLAGQATQKGHKVETITYDLEKPSALHLTGIHYCLVFAGWLPPDNSHPEKAMWVNHTAIQQFVDGLVENNQNTLEHVLITGSIAGVRVRPSNWAYGKAKAALHAYTRGLQKKWGGSFATTLVIPGYVSTKMLDGLSTPGFLTLSAEAMAEKYWGWMSARPSVVYSQPAWWLIGWVLRLMPGFIIRRMKF